MTTPSPDALLDANAKWAEAINESDSNFFRKSAQGQAPKILWIGCSDSRVPETVITDARPGDLFVHRNIANQFRPDDDSALAALTFAVNVVGVEHVIVTGHTECAGAKSCLEAAIAQSAIRDTSTVPTTTTANAANATDSGTPLSRWLTPLADLIASLDGIADADTVTDSALKRVIDENVKKQVANICNAAPVREAWAAGKSLSVHGWVYDLASGRIQDLGISRGPSGGK